jgi:hypothetical protein
MEKVSNEEVFAELKQFAKMLNTMTKRIESYMQKMDPYNVVKQEDMSKNAEMLIYDAISKYNAPSEQYKQVSYGVPDSLRGQGYAVPLLYIQRKLVSHSVFKRVTCKPNEAIKDIINKMLLTGAIRELNKEELYGRYGFRGRAFCVKRATYNDDGDASNNNTIVKTETKEKETNVSLPWARAKEGGTPLGLGTGYVPHPHVVGVNLEPSLPTNTLNSVETHVPVTPPTEIEDLIDQTTSTVLETPVSPLQELVDFDSEAFYKRHVEKCHSDAVELIQAKIDKPKIQPCSPQGVLECQKHNASHSPLPDPDSDDIHMLMNVGMSYNTPTPSLPINLPGRKFVNIYHEDFGLYEVVRVV